MVQIGAGPWLYVPVGKPREDRYLPLHPHLAALIDDYRTRHVDPANPLLLPRAPPDARQPAARRPDALASLAYAKARGATVRRDLIDVASRTARHGRGHITPHLPEGWHREHE